MSFQIVLPHSKVPLMQENLRQRLEILSRPTVAEQVLPQATQNIYSGIHGLAEKTSRARELAALAIKYPQLAPLIEASGAGVKIGNALGDTVDPVLWDIIQKRAGLPGTPTTAPGAPPMPPSASPGPNPSGIPYFLQKPEPQPSLSAGLGMPPGGSTPPTAPIRPTRANVAAAMALGGAQDRNTKDAATKAQKQTASWLQINRVTNPAVAPRGSLLGTAGAANARADRALQTLNDPNATPQQIASVVTDIAGIMQGGAPHEIAEKQQAYGNLWQDLANLKTQVTGSPQAANTPEIVNKLRQVVQDIKAVDNDVIQRNLDTAETTFADTVAADPERWRKHRENVMRTTLGSSATPSPGGRATQGDIVLTGDKAKRLAELRAKLGKK